MEIFESPVNKKRVNLKKEILGVLKYWPWILLSVVIFYLASYFYLKYTQPKYLSRTTLLFKEGSGSGSKGALSDLRNLGMGISGDNELQGEAAIIISKPILFKVGKHLNLDVSFLVKGKIREVELYSNSPFLGQIVASKPAFGFKRYSIEPVDNNHFKLSGGPLLSSEGIFVYGRPAVLPWGTVIINRTEYTPYKLDVTFADEKILVSSLESAIKVQLPAGLLMNLNYTGLIPKKSEDILNELVKQYNIDGVNDKNIEAENTANFIDTRLDLISGDLGKIEVNKENFKKANKITDLDVQAGIAVNRLTGNVENIFTQSAQLQILEEMLSMTNSGKEQLFPTGLGLPSATEALLTQYNNLLLLKKRTLKQATAVNPSILSFNRELAELLTSVKNNLRENINTIQRRIGQTNQEIGEDKASIYKYPAQERTFRNIERQRNLKESLYLYLLQKREENAITLAVTAPKAKVVNPAYTTGIVLPNYSQIRTMSILAGFLLPLAIIFIIKILDTKIRTKQDVDNNSDVPVVAEIPFSDEKNPKIEPNDFTIFAEAFRILMSNLKFILRSREIEKGGVILVTSSVKGEGKTTVSVNTALTLSGSSKVLLIGADIRNPQLHKYVGKELRSGLGLTDYLVSDDTSPQDYIVKGDSKSNLDILFSGAKAPNPNDLLDMKKFDEMVLGLKEIYDYIIMDSAPIMLVSDSLHLVDISDLVIYTLKSEFTDKEMLDFANNFKRDNEVQNMVFVLNNVKPEYSRYGYKYGYGYYSYLKPKSKITKLFGKRFNVIKEN